VATKGPVLLAANEMTAALSKERGGAYNETIKRLSVISRAPQRVVFNAGFCLTGLFSPAE
jgi:hypothetical protein